jgi:hypothetical protein
MNHKDSGVVVDKSYFLLLGPTISRLSLVTWVLVYDSSTLYKTDVAEKKWPFLCGTYIPLICRLVIAGHSGARLGSFPPS